MLKIRYTSQFKKDYKTAIKRGLNLKKLIAVIEILIEKRTLPKKFNDHKLLNSSRYRDVRECHIEADWLLVYKINDNELLLELIRTGSHSDLF